MAEIRLQGLTKRFGPVVAVDRLDLAVSPGEFVSFLGPSGCGKTTTLRMLAGFEMPTEGEIHIGDRDVSGLQPQERNIGIVFQDYAVFPMMNVFDNVAYGLKLRGIRGAELRPQVLEMLRLVGLAGFETRRSSQLSGGQLQRVALARALVIRPGVLLLDEPLSNLDAALRLSIRKEIRKIQRGLGITAVYVTHDQEEALSVSDRIAVMNDGRLDQLGAPMEIYDSPETAFVASFIGRTTLLAGSVVEADGRLVRIRIDRETAPLVAAQRRPVTVGDEVWVSIRPHHLWLAAADDGAAKLAAEVEYVEPLGPAVRGELRTAGGTSFLFEVHDPQSNPVPEVGARLTFTVDPARVTYGRMTDADRQVLAQGAELGAAALSA